MASVRGIGLSGQMHGATLLDGADEVLRPCILWNDTRSHEEAEELDDEEARAITGNIVFPGFTAPKLLWVSRNEPRIFERVRRVLLPKDYLRLWLTGEAASDMSDAAAPPGCAPASGAGHRRCCAGRSSRRPRDAAPRRGHRGERHAARRARQPLGPAAGRRGRGRRRRQCGLGCGVGVTRPGTGFLSLGTSGVLFTASAGYDPVPDTALHTFCHALPGLWHQMGVTLSAAGSLEWLSAFSRETGRARRAGGGRPACAGAASVPAVSLGRAHAPQRRRRARRLHRPPGRYEPRRHGARAFWKARRLLDPRLPGCRPACLVGAPADRGRRRLALRALLKIMASVLERRSRCRPPAISGPPSVRRASASARPPAQTGLGDDPSRRSRPATSRMRRWSNPSPAPTIATARSIPR